MRIYELVVEPDRVDHIALHNVSVEEAEFVCSGAHVANRGKGDRYTILGQTEAGRYLAVIVGARGNGVFGLVTARAMNDAERKYYLRRR